MDREPPIPPFEGLRRKPLTRRRGSLTGVCGGIARYLGVSARWVRLAMVILTPITSGTNLLVYGGLALLLPKEAPDRDDSIRVYEAPVAVGPAGWSRDQRFAVAEETQELCQACDTAARPFARYCHKCGAELTPPEA